MEHEIDLLVTFLWSIKKLSFGTSDLPVAAVLEQTGIVAIEGDNYVVKNHEAIALRFLEVFKHNTAFNNSADFSKLTLLLEELAKSFNAGGYVPQFSYLKRELWKTTVLEANKSFGTDFQAYINTFPKDNRGNELSSFIEAYNEVLPILELTAGTLYSNAASLLALTTNNNTYKHSQSPFAICWGLTKVSAEDETKGKNLLQVALGDTPIQTDILSAVITGLYSEGRVTVYHQHLAVLFQRDGLKMPILNGLATVRQFEESDVDLFIKLINTVIQIPALHLSIIGLLFSILSDKNDFSGKEKYVAIIFIRLKELAALGKEDLTYQILGNFTMLHHYDEERIEAVVFILQQPLFTLEKFGKIIGRIFLFLKSVPLFKKLLLAIAIHHPFIRISGLFEISDVGFDKLAYDEMLIEFITNDTASIRFIGLELFNHQSLQGGYKFDKNILELEPLQQYKLWVGLTQDYKEPEYSVPALLPLLYSTSGIVQEAFICKLEEFTHNYGKQVIKVLEEQMDTINPSNETILARVKEYQRSFYEENIAPKQYLKELNPFYTHHKLFANFHKLHSKLFNTRMHKSVEENSMMLLFGKSVQLAKGGGWKVGGRDNVSKLGTIESSFSLPRDYFIFPNQFEMLESQAMRADWTEEDFAPIREIIENEQ